MLVLTRKTQERIVIGEDIVLTIVRVQGQSVRIGIEAPRDVHIRRGELIDLWKVPEDESCKDTAVEVCI